MTHPDHPHYLESFWRVSENDLIGGWCIQPDGEPRPSDGGIMLGDFWTEKLASYVVELHNAQITASVDQDKQAFDLQGPTELRYRVAVKQRRFGWVSTLLGTEMHDLFPSKTFVRLSREAAIEAAIRAGERHFKKPRHGEVLVLDADR